MTSLPITGNAPQPANTVNAKSNSAAGDQAADAQAVGPFASLLARQISGADSPAPDAVLITLAIDATDTNLKDAQDQATATTDTTASPANVLTAILLQIPQEMRVSVSNGTASNAADTQNSTGIDASPHKTNSLANARFDIAGITPGKTDALAVVPGKTDVSAARTDKQIIVEAASQDTFIHQDAFKYVELPSSLIQTGANTAQAINSPVMSAMMPNVPADNKTTDTIQTIATPLGNKEWADDFSQKIRWVSTQQNQVAELHLNPPDLGPLSIVLKISDNQATALFTSPHSAVRDAVENAVPKLREILADNGIMLGDATVSDQPPRDRGMDGFMNQSSGTAAQREASGDAQKLTVLSAAQIMPVRRHNGMVDTFA